MGWPRPSCLYWYSIAFARAPVSVRAVCCVLCFFVCFCDCTPKPRTIDHTTNYNYNYTYTNRHPPLLPLLNA